MLRINLDFFKTTKPNEDLFRQTYIVKNNVVVWDLRDGTFEQYQKLQHKIMVLKGQGLTVDQVVYVIDYHRSHVVRAIYNETIVLGIDRSGATPGLKGDMAKQFGALFNEWKSTVWEYLFGSYFMVNDANEKAILKSLLEDKVHEYFEGKPHAAWLDAVEDAAEDLLVVWEIAYRAGLRDAE